MDAKTGQVQTHLTFVVERGTPARVQGDTGDIALLGLDDARQHGARSGLDEVGDTEGRGSADQRSEVERLDQLRGQESGEIGAVGALEHLCGDAGDDGEGRSAERQLAEPGSERGHAGPQQGRVIGVGHPQTRHRQVRVGGRLGEGRDRGLGAGDHALAGRVGDGLPEVPGGCRQQEQATIRATFGVGPDANRQHRPALVGGNVDHGLGSGHHPGEAVGEAQDPAGHVGGILAEAVSDHDRRWFRESGQPAVLGNAGSEDGALHRRWFGQGGWGGAQVGVDAGGEGPAVAGVVGLVCLVERGGDAPVAATKVGQLVEILASMTGEQHAIGGRGLDRGEVDLLAPQGAALSVQAGLVGGLHVR